jgi:hypothetical protein
VATQISFWVSRPLFYLIGGILVKNHCENEGDMDPNRVFWNQQQKNLRQALLHSKDYSGAIESFMNQHARLHSSEMAGSGQWSFDDEAWQGVSGAAAREIPRGEEHSFVWIFFHLARIEDVTMNVLLAHQEQVLDQGDWLQKMKTAVRHTGNAMPPEEVVRLSAEVDVEALRAYRTAVGRQTREVVRLLQLEEFRQGVEPAHLQQLLANGDVLEAASGVLEYWGGLNKAELLLMPPTRHIFVHLNEALKIKKKIK